QINTASSAMKFDMEVAARRPPDRHRLGIANPRTSRESRDTETKRARGEKSEEKELRTAQLKRKAFSGNQSGAHQRRARRCLLFRLSSCDSAVRERVREVRRLTGSDGLTIALILGHGALSKRTPFRTADIRYGTLSERSRWTASRRRSAAR